MNHYTWDFSKHCHNNDMWSSTPVPPEPLSKHSILSLKPPSPYQTLVCAPKWVSHLSSLSQPNLIMHAHKSNPQFSPCSINIVLSSLYSSSIWHIQINSDFPCSPFIQVVRLMQGTHDYAQCLSLQFLALAWLHNCYIIHWVSYWQYSHTLYYPIVSPCI